MDKELEQTEKYNLNMVWSDADDPPTEMHEFIPNYSRQVIIKYVTGNLGVAMYYHSPDNKPSRWSVREIVVQWAYVTPPDYKDGLPF